MEFETPFDVPGFDEIFTPRNENTEKEHLEFRIWSVKDNEFLDPHVRFVYSIDLLGDVVKSYTDSCESPVEYPSDELIIEQWSGVWDKDGRKIFSGDIVRQIFAHDRTLTTEHILAIEFKCGCFQDTNGAPVYAFSDCCEIIGNIHQHSELINP